MLHITIIYQIHTTSPGLLIHDMVKDTGPDGRLVKEQLYVNIRYQMIETLSCDGYS